MTILKVSADSNAKKTAGSITKSILNGEEVEVQAIGEKAVNQSVKAIAISRGQLALNGIDIRCIPAFFNVKFNGANYSGIKFIIDF